MSRDTVNQIQLIYKGGQNGLVKNSIHFVDENSVLYPAGSDVVHAQMEPRKQSYLHVGAIMSGAAAAPAAAAGGPASPNAAATSSAAAAAAAAAAVAPPAGFTSSGDISAMASCNLSGGGRGGGKAGADGGAGGGGGRKRMYLAVATRGDPGRSLVVIFDVHSKKLLRCLACTEIGSGEVVSMAFSPDGKYLLTQGGGPDYTLINWSWEKNKPLQIAKVSNQSGAVIHQASFCPTDPSVVCITGNGILRFLHLEQSEFKSIPFSMGKREPQNYLSHCWIDDRILIGTDSGDILVFENAEFRGVLESSPAGGKSIDCIAAFSKGFVLGMDEGYLMMFDRDDKEIYKYARSFQIDGNFVKIKSLAISPNEENVVAVLENNQSYILGLNQHTDLLVKSSGAGGGGGGADEMAFQTLHEPNNFMAITGMDCCILKPHVAICGADRSVRIVQYPSGKVLISRYFNETPHSISFHPQGLMLLVGFTDNLRLLNILMDDVQPFRDFAIKSCKECQFSNGGQYFAAANGSVIQVFATYTCEMLGSFNVHKAKVRSLAWTADDSAIVSAGMDGCVFSTKISSGEHVALAKHKCNYTSVVVTGDGVAYLGASDRHLKIIKDGVLSAELNCGVNLTALATQMPRPQVKERFLFAGTESGIVRVFPTPVEGKCYDQQVHTGAITRIRCTPDDNYLLTAGEDGVLCIFSIEQKRDAGGSGASRSSRAVGSTDHGGGVQWSDEVQVPSEDLREKLAILAALEAQVRDLKDRNDATLQLKDAAFKEKMRETSERFTEQLRGDQATYSALEEDKEKLEKSYADKVEQLSKLQSNKLRELEAHHQEKMAQEANRRADLEARHAAMRANNESELAEMDDSFHSERNALSDAYERKIDEARALKMKLVGERAAIRTDLSDTTSAMEADADAELDEIKAAYDKKLTSERTQTLHLKDENAVLKRKFGLLREGVTENLDDLERRRDKQTALYESIDSLEKDIKGHVKEIKERESTIADKRSRIFELKKKNQELEKFKFVLDYKITELKRQIQPRKMEMKVLAEQIAEMDKELRNYKKESADLALDVTELNLKSDGMDANLLKDTRARAEVVAHLAHVKTELHEVFQEIDNPKALKAGMVRLFQRHVQNAEAVANMARKNREKEEAAAAAMAAAVALAAAQQGGGAGVTSSASASAAAAAALALGGSGSGFKSSTTTGVDDVHSDYARQRHYLERSIDSHNAKCKKDMRVHIKEHTRIMQENIALTKEVNELRREKYHILVQQKAKDAAKTGGNKAGAAAAGASPASQQQPGALAARGRMSRTLNDLDSSLHGPSASSAAIDAGLVVLGEETEVQQEQIRALKRQLAVLEAEYTELVHGGAAAASTTTQQLGGSASARGGLSARGSEKLPALRGAAGSSPESHGSTSKRDLAEVTASLQHFNIDGSSSGGSKDQEHKE